VTPARIFSPTPRRGARGTRPRRGTSLAPSLAPGTTFAGDYRIVELLGEGGMGSVYVAEHLFTGQRCALKLISPELVAHPALRRPFEQEARIATRIESDQVVHVLATGVDAATGAPWIAMELNAARFNQR
jgi:serine/threonine protein kinase